MSDCIIRFSGSYINNNLFIGALSNQLEQNQGRSFLVVSVAPFIKDKIETAISTVFNSENGTNKLKDSLIKFWESGLPVQPISDYLQLVEKLVNILEGIRLTGDYSQSLKGQLLSLGEKLTVVLLKQKLVPKSIHSTVLLPEEYGFLVSDDFGNATYLSIDTQKLDGLPSTGLFFIPGSYGITENGKIARAGNSASDYTAAFLTAFIKAPKLTLWGLEKEFLSADPSVISNTSKIKRLTYSEASELAYFDHYSIHPRVVEPLEAKHIPIEIVGVETNNVETIINTETYIADQVVKSVAYSDDISVLKLDGAGVGLKPGILAIATKSFTDAGINVKSVITSQTSINFILDKHSGERAKQLVHESGLLNVNEVKLLNDVVLIGIVGHGMQQSYGVSATLFTAVARNKINVIISGSGASDLASYLVVKSSDRNKSIKAIYSAFFSAE